MTPWAGGVQGGGMFPDLGSRGHLTGSETTVGGPRGDRAGTMKEIQPLPNNHPKQGRWEKHRGFCLPLPLQSLTRASHLATPSWKPASKSSSDTNLQGSCPCGTEKNRARAWQGLENNQASGPEGYLRGTLTGRSVLGRE